MACQVLVQYIQVEPSLEILTLREGLEVWLTRCHSELNFDLIYKLDSLLECIAETFKI